MPIRIRAFTSADTRAIMDLFYGTVHTINIQHYSREQVDAWAPAEMDYERWEQSLSRSHAFVADAGMIAGFADVEENGHLDRFYVHKDYQRGGIGTLLLAAIEDTARALENTRLFAEVSITARPFFERRGFVVVREQRVERRDMIFTNFVMEKML